MILALEVINVVTRISRFDCSSLRRCYANNESLCPNLGQSKKEERGGHRLRTRFIDLRAKPRLRWDGTPASVQSPGFSRSDCPLVRRAYWTLGFSALVAEVVYSDLKHHHINYAV